MLALLASALALGCNVDNVCTRHSDCPPSLVCGERGYCAIAVVDAAPAGEGDGGTPADAHDSPVDAHGSPADAHDSPADAHDSPADAGTDAIVADAGPDARPGVPDLAFPGDPPQVDSPWTNPDASIPTVPDLPQVGRPGTTPDAGLPFKFPGDPPVYEHTWNRPGDFPVGDPEDP